jgi:hypothetical protein
VGAGLGDGRTIAGENSHSPGFKSGSESCLGAGMGTLSCSESMAKAFGEPSVSAPSAAAGDPGSKLRSRSSFVDEDNAIAPKIRQFVDGSCDRQNLGDETIFVHIVLRNLHEIPRAENEGFGKLIVLENSCDGVAIKVLPSPTTSPIKTPPRLFR